MIQILMLKFILKMHHINRATVLFAILISNSAFGQWANTGNNAWNLNSTSSASAATGNQLGSFGLSVTNPSSSVNTINASVASGDGTQGSGSGSGSISYISVFGYGGGAGLSGANGPNINFNSSTGGVANFVGTTFTGATMQNPAYPPTSTSSNPTYMTGPGSVMNVISNGSSAGFINSVSNNYSFNGANGGAVNVNVTGGSFTLLGNGSGNMNIPWQPNASAINAASVGGTPISNTSFFGAQQIGNGGNGGDVNITNNADITIGSADTPVSGNFNGITALSTGAAGSICCATVDGWSTVVQITPTYVNSVESSTDPGFGVNGNGGNVGVINSGAISSWSANSTGIVAASIGSSSQMSPNYLSRTPYFYAASSSGVGGNVSVNNSGELSLLGQNSMGIFAASSAQQIILPSGLPVFGASTTSGNINIQNTGKITVGTPGSSGNFVSGGILALSSPGWMIGPTTYMVNSSTTAGIGGSVDINNSDSVSVHGNSAFGIAAVSVGNSGILSNSSATTNSYYMGNGATTNSSNSQGGSSSVINSGSIKVAGQGSAGILSMSSGDGGVISNLANPVYSSSVTTNTVTKIQTANLIGGTIVGNSSGAYIANGGASTVSNSGSVTTGMLGGGGETSIGILAQSIGGGGGHSGGTAAAFQVGDSGGTGGAGGSVIVNNTGSVNTLNDGSHGILAQSIGGGGGNGAGGAGGFVAVGGSGGKGGNGGSVGVNNGVSGQSIAAQINTFADYSVGIAAQSIGGGGGNGGYSKGYGVFASFGIGGTGGDGGAGGAIDFVNYGNIQTAGDQSQAILLQSIGGGGGIGGAASSYSAGVALATSVAVGGSGGVGGDGGGIGSSTAPILNASNIYTAGNDAIGLLAQSIGGGGGTGGSTVAKSWAASPYKEIPAISYTSSIGGSGGVTGSGGSVDVQNTGVFKTVGTNSHGIVLQSIGGGGGNGGDASAGADAIGFAEVSIELAMGVGGASSAGGNGGTVSFNNATTGLISTYGNFSNGILAQSIGGGGGLSGIGNSTQPGGAGGEITITPSIGIGGKGGGGGSGGVINISNGGTIATTGSSSSAITAQSIGGGGGIGGNAGVYGTSGSIDANIAIGGNGGAGGNAGAVNVTNNGNINTGASILFKGNYSVAIGGDSHGIIAQSISGGGGVGGSADPSANLISSPISILFDKVVDPVLTWKNTYKFFFADSATPPISYIAKVGVGGTGGVGGTAGVVGVTNAGNIQTIGHRSFGILAQSIGGGGGTGGSVMSGSSAVGSSASGGVSLGALKGLTFDTGVNVGGSGGTSSAGNTVNITQSGNIVTTGYGSHGVVAQSIGGGGGVGADGSIAANTGFTGSASVNGGVSGGFSLALGSISSQPSIGSGGAVNYGNGNTPSSITTYGDNAVGILAQSIGGGGGIASGGCTNNGLSASASACFTNTTLTAGTTAPIGFINGGQAMALSINPSPGSSTLASNAGSITVNSSDAINVNGSGSIGIAAQGIGGGGGLILANAANISSATLPLAGTSNGTGGFNVTVNANGNINLNQSAQGAIGILTQSIGGGGGYLGDPNAFNPLSATSYSSPLINTGTNINTAAGGGNVQPTVNGNIILNGPNQIGVIAQSIGGGGGIASVNGTTTTQNASAGSGTVPGLGGQVQVQVNGSIIDNGNKGGTVGIFAQSSGNAQSNYGRNIITVLLEGTKNPTTGVFVGAQVNANTGIIVSGGSNTSSTPNNLYVGQGASITVPSGNNAVVGIDGYSLLRNEGTISGGIALGPTPGFSGSGGDLINSGTINATAPISTSNDSFKNYGKVYVAGSGIVGETDIYGSYKHFSTGTTYFDISTTQGSHDFMKIVADGISAGTMLQGGSFKINRLDSNVLPAKGVTNLLLTAQGGYLANADGVNAAPISISDTSPLVTWSLLQNGNNLSAQYQGLNANPAGYSFNKNQQSFLNYVIDAYNVGDAGVNNAIGNIVSNGAAANLSVALNSLNGAAQTIQPQTIVMTGNTMLGNALSCPTFEKNGTGYGETECVWGKYNGGQMRQASSDTNTGYTVNDNTFSIGAQFRAGANSFWGAAVRFGFNNSTSTNFAANSNVWDVSVGYKKIVGDYMLGLSGAVGVASQKNNRYTTDYFTGQGYKLTSDSQSYYGGLRARNAYQFNLQNNLYIRPYLDLDLLWIHSPSYQESGSAYGVPLRFASQNSFNFIASPMVELGAKFNLESNKDAWVRPFISAGAMFITNNTTNLTASIVGANSGTYQLSSKAPSALFNANLGIQIFSGKNLDAKLEYSIQAGQGFVGQSGMAKLNYRF
jgi:hypothetical protein